ncbi:type IV toxin-antitoxin system AbiEi family antitoxin [Microbacterium sp. BK668]|uniref:type IV toxin-antitoxin system AbiEi family antitoxin n=1 Tax=Microbacterium sp. BK668 TaxID=2512118 RepID=UPI00105E6FEF|nr:type IV toxin-antitoxin system AbiEi family antitoxin [Microbacterium sp. BK668]TDN92933.1 transcriptional regulator with AbiEi antitoxin domain of type IV toxin-antitoxin system [Microbacterium sp. BK668]
MTTPFLYFPGDRLSPAELSAARLDGDVVELGEAYIPADAVETRALRAGSLRGILGETLAATHLSAAWVHGALPEPPARHTVQRAVPWRIHQVIDRRAIYRDPEVATDDLWRIGGVLVTSPQRTLADLARVPDDDYAEAARLVSDAFPGLALEAVAWFEQRRPVPHKRTAVAFLQGLSARSAQEDVTR